jgi:hypothetical protein
MDRDVLLLDLGWANGGGGGAGGGQNGGSGDVVIGGGGGGGGSTGAGGVGGSGPQQTQFLALYNWRTAKVRAFVSSTSDAAAALLLR